GSRLGGFEDRHRPPGGRASSGPDTADGTGSPVGASGRGARRTAAARTASHHDKSKKQRRGAADERESAHGGQGYRPRRRLSAECHVSFLRSPRYAAMA